jgi:hypothetical protein
LRELKIRKKVRIVRFSLENAIGFEARNRSPDLRLAWLETIFPLAQ